MSWQTEIYSALSGDASVSALVGTRIFPELGPDGVACPFCIYELDTVTPELELTGDAQLDRVEISITSWGTTQDSAYSVARAVRLALSGYTAPGASPAMVGPVNFTAFRTVRTDRFFGVIADFAFFSKP